MSEKKKRNIIIGALCTVLLLMVVGYAAFQSVLKIKGTSTINSNWDVRITNIEKIENKGATDNEGSPSYDNTNGLSATFNTSFTTPGDYATYKIEITNNGSLDAVLKNITMPENTNNDIIFYLNKNQNNVDINGALTQNDTLFKSGETGNIGYVYVTVLYRDYENQKTPTKENATANMTITFDFEQSGGNGGTVGSQTAADKLIATEVATGDGLYADEYEEGRYVYKGANPNNYITFNNETWRIISVETDGTLKIMRKDSIGNIAWNTANSNNWARPATSNTYLNTDYYNTLSSDAQDLIETHSWGIGAVTYENADITAQIESENGTTWTGNIGLMNLSDYLRANTNTEQCGNLSLNNSNLGICKTTNYIVPTGYLWTISPIANNVSYVCYVNFNGYVSHSPATFITRSFSPTLYLTPNITLEGEGTESNPYTIVS